MYNTKIQVNFFDADPAGIIFYANIFRFAHCAYEEFMISLLTEKNYFFDEEFVLPITHTEADYIKPIKAGDELTINLHVANLKKGSFELSYSFCNSEKIEVAKVKTVHVCVSKLGFHKAELPDELYNKLSRNLR